MKAERRGMMRGYKKLRVWQDAKALYVLTWKIFKGFPYELSRIRSQQLASVDSMHRNIAEGYCRRSLQEKAGKEWSDTFVLKESNALYITGVESETP